MFGCSSTKAEHHTDIFIRSRVNGNCCIPYFCFVMIGLMYMGVIIYYFRCFHVCKWSFQLTKCGKNLFYQCGKMFYLLYQRLVFVLERLLENSISKNFGKLVIKCAILPVTFTLYCVVNLNYLNRFEYVD